MEVKPRYWNSAAVLLGVLVIAGCGSEVSPRPAMKADTLGSINWKLNGQEIESGIALSLQPGKTVEISGVLAAPKNWRFSPHGTKSFLKGFGSTPQFPVELLKEVFDSVPESENDATPLRVALNVLQFEKDGKASGLNLADAAFMSALVAKNGTSCHLRANLKIPDTQGSYWLVLYSGSVAEETYNEFQPTDFGLVPVAEVRITIR